MIGITRMPMPSPAASIALGPGGWLKNGLTTSGATKLRMKKPTMTDGMPARISMIGLTMLRTRRRCVLREVDRRAKAERHGDDHGDRCS